MQRSEMEGLVARYTAAWNDCDVEGVVACFSADAVNRDIAVRVPIQGRERIGEVVADFMSALSDMSRVVFRITCEGNVMCVEWHMTGTHSGEIMGIPATGRRVEYDGCSVMRIDAEGLIATLTNYWDVAGALHQIGALEPEPTHVPRERSRGTS